MSELWALSKQFAMTVVAPVLLKHALINIIDDAHVASARTAVIQHHLTAGKRTVQLHVYRIAVGLQHTVRLNERRHQVRIARHPVWPLAVHFTLHCVQYPQHRFGFIRTQLLHAPGQRNGVPLTRLPRYDRDRAAIALQHNMGRLRIGVEVELGRPRDIADSVPVAAHDVEMARLLQQPWSKLHGQCQICQRTDKYQIDASFVRVQQTLDGSDRVFLLQGSAVNLDPEVDITEPILAVEVAVVFRSPRMDQWFVGTPVHGHIRTAHRAQYGERVFHHIVHARIAVHARDGDHLVAVRFLTLQQHPQGPCVVRTDIQIDNYLPWCGHAYCSALSVSDSVQATVTN
uniref:Uncharacterized protein n=1 Tax=Anopheles melas TaxID=34690 RepID=A0A182UBC4_9DIPT